MRAAFVALAAGLALQGCAPPVAISTPSPAPTVATAEPTPSEIASGMGASRWEASYSLFITLSRMSAQPAVFTSVTLSPCFS